MAGPVQWSIDQLYGALQSLYTRIQGVDAALNADKAELTRIYAAAKLQYEPARTHDLAMITPLIHRNSQLRLSYLKPIKDKYAQAVNIASQALRSAGYTTPGLSGMGAVFAIAPAAAVTLVLVAVLAIAALELLTRSQRDRTTTMRELYADPNTTPAQKLALAQVMDKQMKDEPGPLGLGSFDWVVPALGIVAVIILAPALLKMMPGKRATA